jgi:hypothetical protein
MEKLLNFDPLTGLSEWHSYDPLTDTTTIKTMGDSTPYLEINKKMANDNDFTKKGIKSEFWLYASIPPAVQVKWLIEEGLDVYNRHHGPRLSQKLEDPQWKYLKTTVKHHKIK